MDDNRQTQLKFNALFKHPVPIDSSRPLLNREHCKDNELTAQIQIAVSTMVAQECKLSNILHILRNTSGNLRISKVKDRIEKIILEEIEYVL